MTSPFVWLESRCRYTCFILFYVYYMSCVHMCVCMFCMHMYAWWICIFRHMSHISIHGILLDAICMLWLCLHSSRKTHFPGYVRIAAEEYSLDDFGDRFFGKIRGFWLFRASLQGNDHISHLGRRKNIFKRPLKGELIQIPKIISLRA